MTKTIISPHMGLSATRGTSSVVPPDRLCHGADAAGICAERQTCARYQPEAFTVPARMWLPRVTGRECHYKISLQSGA